MSTRKKLFIIISIAVILTFGIIVSILLLHPSESTVEVTDYSSTDNWLTLPDTTGYVGNIYAPYYRHPDAVTSLSFSEEAKDELLSGVTKSDVFASFDYYIKHYNNGRPFILAGHSLGSNMLLYLLSDYMESNQMSIQGWLRHM